MKACMLTYGNWEGQRWGWVKTEKGHYRNRSDTIELNDSKLHLKQKLGPETPKAKNTVTCCKGHDFSVRPCSSPLHSSVYNRTQKLDYVLLCPLIISHARSSLYLLRNGSKSQRGAQLLRRTKQEKVEKKRESWKICHFCSYPIFAPFVVKIHF